MKIFINLCIASTLLLGLCGVVNANTINYAHSLGNGGYTSPYSGVTVYTFDSGVMPTGFSGNGAIVTGSSSGYYAAPYGPSAPDATKYFTVPKAGTPGSTGSETIVLSSAVNNYFGLWWGSVDSYNSIEFLDKGKAVGSYTGSDVINPNAANGNQTAPSTNLYVNFLGLPNFDEVILSSTQYAFEVDNVAVGNVNTVPEPSTMILLGIGLLSVAGARRRFQK